MISIILTIQQNEHGTRIDLLSPASISASPHEIKLALQAKDLLSKFAQKNNAIRLSTKPNQKN